MKTKEIQELSVGEVEKKIRDTRDELLQLRMKKQTGQLEKSHMLQELQRDIARMETIRRQKLAAAEPA